MIYEDGFTFPAYGKIAGSAKKTSVNYVKANGVLQPVLDYTISFQKKINSVPARAERGIVEFGRPRYRRLQSAAPDLRMSHLRK